MVSDFLANLLIMENSDQLVIIHPGDQEAAWVHTVELLHSVSEVCNSIGVSQLVDSHAVVIIFSRVLIILDKEAIILFPFGLWDWQADHKEWIESN